MIREEKFDLLDKAHKAPKELNLGKERIIPRPSQVHAKPTQLVWVLTSLSRISKLAL
jgi:hypothetical protein